MESADAAMATHAPFPGTIAEPHKKYSSFCLMFYFADLSFPQTLSFSSGVPTSND